MSSAGVKTYGALNKVGGVPTYRAQVAKGFIFSTVGTNLKSQTATNLSLHSTRKLFNELAYKAQESFVDTPVSLGEYKTYRIKQNNFRGEFLAPKFNLSSSFEAKKYHENKKKVILYVHGGAFFSGNPATHRVIPFNVMRNLHLDVLSCDYAKIPEYPFNTALENVYEAFQYLVTEKRYSPENIVLLADSAGANLAISLSFHLQKLGKPQPAAIAALTPILDLSLRGQSHELNEGVDPLFGGCRPLLESISAKYVRNEDPENHLISPVLANERNLRDLPPTLILSGEDDVFYSDSELFASRAVQAGNNRFTHLTFSNMFHSWMLFNIPETFLAARHISKFFFDHLKLEE